MCLAPHVVTDDDLTYHGCHKPLLKASMPPIG